MTASAQSAVPKPARPLSGNEFLALTDQARPRFALDQLIRSTRTFFPDAQALVRSPREWRVLLSSGVAVTITSNPADLHHPDVPDAFREAVKQAQDAQDTWTPADQDRAVDISRLGELNRTRDGGVYPLAELDRHPAVPAVTPGLYVTADTPPLAVEDVLPPLINTALRREPGVLPGLLTGYHELFLVDEAMLAEQGRIPRATLPHRPSTQQDTDEAPF